MSYIAVSGPGDTATPNQTLLAYQVGELLAVAGHTILTGGLAGVMSAAAAGCRLANGTSIGFLPGENRADGSPTHTFLLPTGLGEERDSLLVRTADAVVVIGNSKGTLTEATLAQHLNKPLLVLEGSDLPLDVEEIELGQLEARVNALT